MSSEQKLVFRLKTMQGYVDGTTYRDTDLASIPTNTILLNLEGAHISDDGILSLPELKSLRCIDLDSTGITDKAIEKIRSFLNLEEIWLEDTNITDAGLAQLSQLKKLRFISVLDCAVSDRAVERLRQSIPGVEVH